MANYTPFIVYATDTPSYPSGEMWPYDAWPAWRRPTYAKSKPGEIRGSLIVVSGGYLMPRDEEAGSHTEQPMMYVGGCLEMQYEVGERYCEQVVGGLVPDDARVTMVLYTSRTEESLADARRAGFEVIETGNVTSGIDSAFAICLGTGRMLGEYEWLTHVWRYEPFLLHASLGPESQFERTVVDAARRKVDPEAAAVELLRQVQQNPAQAETILGSGFVHVNFTDPDSRSLLIMRADPDTASAVSVLSRVAKDMDVALFDAGSLRYPDEEGHYFTEFGFWDRLLPLLRHWRRVV